ncbi:MAG: hypothetical protein ACFHVJ_04885 [Aestuariibacter sp.]
MQPVFRYIVLLFILGSIVGCADFTAARLALEQEEYIDAESHYQELAEKGFQEASEELAKLYASGVLGPEKQLKALAIYEKSYADGNDEAVYPLAMSLLEFGNTDEQKYRAVKLLKKAAEQGISGADYTYAKMLLFGEWTEQDVAGAMQLLDSLAPENIKAVMLLAKTYRDGVLVEHDRDKALKYFRIAYDAGQISAGLALAGLIAEIPSTQNLETAEQLFRELISQGSILANYRLAEFLDAHQKGSRAEIAQYLEVAVKGGVTDGKLRLADMYRDGDGVPQNGDKAMAIYSDLMEQGDPIAITRIGDVYRDGKIRETDYERSLAMYQRAVQLEYMPSELRIADMLKNGLGTDKDLPTALLLYQKFAEQGDAGAAYHASQIMREMDDKGQYSETAWRWLIIAADSGHQVALYEQALQQLIPESNYFDEETGRRILQELAEEDFAKAHLQLAELYQEMPQSLEILDKVQWHFSKAHEQGNVQAAMKLAEFYMEAPKSHQDLDRAKVLFQQLLARGNPVAGYKLARIIEMKLGEGSMTPELAKLYRDAAGHGYTPAVLRVADMEMSGLGAEQNTDRAHSTYVKLSQKEVGAATFRIGKLYEFGEQVKEQDHQQAFRYYQLALQQGYELSRLKLAYYHYSGLLPEANYQMAISLLTPLVETQHPKAGYEMARLFSSAREKVSDNWFQRALSWYQKASEWGHIQSLYEQAQLIEAVIDRQSPAATHLYFQAAESGHALSILEFGKRRFDGVFVDKDEIEGLAYILAATRLQTEDALTNLLSYIDSSSEPVTLEQLWRKSGQLLPGVANLQM